MNVLHISTYDRRGGACIAANRQHEALGRATVNSHMWVQQKDTPDVSVTAFRASQTVPRRIRRIVRRSYLRFIRKHHRADELFSDDRSEHGGDECAALPPHDVVNIHWTGGFLDHPSLSRYLAPTTPLVYTMHDMNPFTGGCHYNGQCPRFTSQCGACPRLTGSDGPDLSTSIWRRKQLAYSSHSRSKLCFVANSHWLAEQARRSTLLREIRIEVIHYGLDLLLFHPLAQHVARQALGIPMSASVLAFAAADITNVRKGVHHLFDALKNTDDRPFLLTWGSGYPDALRQFQHLHLGELSSERLMALAYNCADVCVVPSTEEAFGQTALEAIACGRPVVAFGSGGLLDIVQHGYNGFIARNGDSRDLRIAIERLLADRSLRLELGEQGRRFAEQQFSYAHNAARYMSLYNELMQAKNGV